jgi:hypothetical protein
VFGACFPLARQIDRAYIFRTQTIDIRSMEQYPIGREGGHSSDRRISISLGLISAKPLTATRERACDKACYCTNSGAWIQWKQLGSNAVHMGM